MTRRAISGGAPRIGPHRKDASGATGGRDDVTSTQGSSEHRKGVARR